MSFYTQIKSYFTPKPPAPPATPPRPAHLAGHRARLTTASSQDLPFASALFIVPPPDSDSTWRTLTLDSLTLSKMSPADLITYMVDLSPEISRALFDFIRMFNPGWECEVYRLSSERIERRGQAVVDAFITELARLYGTPDVVINRLILAGFIRGAFFSEIVFDEAGRLPVDLAAPDPYSARFRVKTDPVRGPVWQLGQYQSAGWVDLTSPTVSYIPIDPLPTSPYGRALIGPAIFLGIFLVGLLHDLRRVVQQQGYPRLDLAVKMELLRDAIPGDLGDDPAEFQQWVNDTITQIADVFASLEPDDAYVHTDIVEVNQPVGAVDSSSLGAVDGLILALERMITRALKTMPLMMGLQEGGSETHANRQWEIHAAGIKAIQHLLESQLNALFGLILQAQGIQGRVEFEFAELRASEMLRDAQTEAMLIANAKAKYEAGWISQDEAAQEVTGHAADAPTPRSAAPQPEMTQGDGEGEAVASDESRILLKWLEAEGNANGKH